jgi:KipI family sensor histidine kinase inhibitor
MIKTPDNAYPIKFTKQYMGETCIVFTFGNCIDCDLSKQVLSIYSHLKKSINYEELDILNIVPSYTSIAIYFTIESPLINNDSLLDNKIYEINSMQNYSATIHIIDTDYNGEDLDYLTTLHKISREQLIFMHTKPKYLIAMLGFKPYFPYLIGLNPKLVTPRRSSPRLEIKSGSIAIGGGQTGIYTSDSPGGWHIIGKTKFNEFHLFKPGDYIKFVESKIE